MADISSAQDTIVAPATAQGVGAIAVVRLSGQRAVPIAQALFHGKALGTQPSHTLHFGTIRDAGKIVDEVVLSLFKAPRSFTGEDVVEISCHGSPLIVKEIVKLAIGKGARPAEPGEFTRRAFLNGRMDLVQAEAVADLISAETEAARRVAVNQMRGGFSKKIKALRKALIDFASLIELELDFAEEDVEFAQRNGLKKLIGQIQDAIAPLIASFDQGNVIKRGVHVVIAGKPNTGKSTLLNRLLDEDRAIVSDIPGTTRDVIEDEVVLDGIQFRFIDTAGLRNTTDPIEATGVARAKDLIEKATLVVYLFDLNEASLAEIKKEMKEWEAHATPFVRVGNKADIADPARCKKLEKEGIICISAHRKADVGKLKTHILDRFQHGTIKSGDVVVSNMRHYHHLEQTRCALARVTEGLETHIGEELLATDIRQALHHLGELTGEITNDDLLGNIFSKFCIGK